LVHSTAWEVAFGLKRSLAFHPEWEPAGGPSVERSLRVLARTRFSERDLAALPATLAGLAQGASAPPLASTVAALLRHDPGYLELSPATHLHAEVLAGRFSPRIFLTVADAAERQAFRNYVEAAKTTNQGLAELPHRFAGVHAVLVLFFNVFRDDGTIAATPVVAFWQEYALSDRTAYELPFAEMARRIRFYTVEGVRGGAADPLRYQTVDPLRMTTRTFLDVKPTIPGVEVTTLRAHCLACHLTRVATFDTHGMRRTSFTPPLVRAEREVLTPFYQVFEGRLRQWMDEYHVNSSPGPSR
ncbi:MAG TPA: hypothetical protein VOA87_21835, partial [Thermoanaerobaculia bacterium]|nr:hypothetical protein [Thermoanaerobaculia bacterium]